MAKWTCFWTSATRILRVYYREHSVANYCDRWNHLWTNNDAFPSTRECIRNLLETRDWEFLSYVMTEMETNFLVGVNLKLIPRNSNELLVVIKYGLKIHYLGRTCHLVNNTMKYANFIQFTRTKPLCNCKLTLNCWFADWDSWLSSIHMESDFTDTLDISVSICVPRMFQLETNSLLHSKGGWSCLTFWYSIRGTNIKLLASVWLSSGMWKT